MKTVEPKACRCDRAPHMICFREDFGKKKVWVVMCGCGRTAKGDTRTSAIMAWNKQGRR